MVDRPRLHRRRPEGRRRPFSEVAGRIAIGRRQLIRKAWKLGVCGVIAILSVLGLAGAVIADRAEGLVVTDVGAVPARPTVIVPGARVEPDGQPGLNVGDRLAAAAALVDLDVVDHVLVSGDNRESHYNEPVVMRNWLVDSAGIDPADITVDYAGLDTWDTCRRANEQFGVAEAVVVTQDLYADRTAALCTAAGIDTVVLAVNSPHQPLPTRSRLWLRERLAAVKAWRDIVRRPPPHHGGPFIGLVGSVGMPEGGHPPDWDWQTTPSPGAVTAPSPSTTDDADEIRPDRPFDAVTDIRHDVDLSAAGNA